MNKKVFLFLLITSVGGCVTPGYVKPTGENTATLKITTKTLESYNQQSRIFNDSNCSDYPGQIISVLQSKIIGNDTKESAETTLQAGDLITISVLAAVPRDDSFWEMFFKGIERTASENSHCEAFASFTPEPGATYHAIYKIDGSPCSLDIMKIEDGNGIAVTNARPNQACAATAKVEHEKRYHTKLFTN